MIDFPFLLKEDDEAINKCEQNREREHNLILITELWSSCSCKVKRLVRTERTFICFLKDCPSEHLLHAVY